MISANDASDGKAYADSHSANQKKDTLVGFTNTRNGIIPTGILMKITLPVMLTLAGFAGIVSVLLKKRKKEEN